MDVIVAMTVLNTWLSLVCLEYISFSDSPGQREVQTQSSWADREAYASSPGDVNKEKWSVVIRSMSNKSIMRTMDNDFGPFFDRTGADHLPVASNTARRSEAKQPAASIWDGWWDKGEPACWETKRSGCQVVAPRKEAEKCKTEVERTAQAEAFRSSGSDSELACNRRQMAGLASDKISQNCHMRKSDWMNRWWSGGSVSDWLLRSEGS